MRSANWRVGKENDESGEQFIYSFAAMFLVSAHTAVGILNLLI